MLAALTLLGLGFLLGMRHATDADHVVAVSTIVSRERSLASAAGIGMMWGIGHTFPVVLVGSAYILLRTVIPPRLVLGLEMGVAIMLIVLGIHNLAAPAGRASYHRARPLIVGVVHGLAGSAAAAILILATVGTPKWAMLALGMFGLGTVAGMMLVTLVLAIPALYAMSRFARAERPIIIASGIASVAFGLMLAHRVGFVEGLFTVAGR